ncbi:MAG TPA: glycosyl hydrolase 115 family protein, partial [Gemmatimonadales bacterium]|nr:glycosyl hydrolase 115 family protein [Gemmatimonadales bacterium]
MLLASGSSGAEIVVGAAEDLNVRQAATFLAGDIEAISGYRPPVVAAPTAGKTSIRLVTVGNGPLPSAIDVATLRGQWEAYRVITAPATVWLVGSNPRGTAFATYTLSERLGVDPLYLWTGYVPAHHDPLVLKATRFAQGPPTFRYRGFFHDDEDILPRPFDARGYPLQTGDVPLAWYRRYFETALRLRMNMVAPYVRVHRRFEVQQLASDWGLYYTSHHYDILVSNPFGLTTFNLAAERGVRPDYDWFTNRDGLLTFWRGGVAENHDLDVIWPVGLRNTSDRAYTWPEGTTDDDKARVFREVIGLQTGMVRDALPPGHTAIFHFTMYSEMLDLYRRDPKAFGLPNDVIIVWPDDNDGHMRGLPTDRGRWKHGVYYHLAYLGGNLSKQTTHTVAPATIAGEFQKIVQAGATEYMLVNV